jgi:hypothetical protein
MRTRGSPACHKSRSINDLDDIEPSLGSFMFINRPSRDRAQRVRFEDSESSAWPVDDVMWAGAIYDFRKVSQCIDARRLRDERYCPGPSLTRLQPPVDNWEHFVSANNLAIAMHAGHCRSTQHAHASQLRTNHSLHNKPFRSHEELDT